MTPHVSGHLGAAASIEAPSRGSCGLDALSARACPGGQLREYPLPSAGHPPSILVTVTSTGPRRSAVCEWCGSTFLAPRRGRMPTYCKTSHRIRAYEQRKMAAAIAEAAQGSAPPETVTRSRDRTRAIPSIVRVTSVASSTALQELQAAVAEAAAVTVTKPNELRTSIENLGEAIRLVLAAKGLPEIDPSSAASWELVVPASKALREAEATLAAAPRSARSLHAAQGKLLAAAEALSDPEAHAQGSLSWGRSSHLAIAVPGPDGALPAGVFETDVVGRRKSVFWAPGDDAFRGEPLATVVGRPEGFRYRWEDKRVWEQLAHDMIVVSCGWRANPEWMPAVLRGAARAALGQQLRLDLGGTADWALGSDTIVGWLARRGHISVIATGRSRPGGLSIVRSNQDNERGRYS